MHCWETGASWEKLQERTILINITVFRERCKQLAEVLERETLIAIWVSSVSTVQIFSFPQRASFSFLNHTIKSDGPNMLIDTQTNATGLYSSAVDPVSALRDCKFQQQPPSSRDPQWPGRGEGTHKAQESLIKPSLSILRGQLGMRQSLCVCGFLKSIWLWFSRPSAQLYKRLLRHLQENWWTRDHQAKWNKPDSEIKNHVFPLLWDFFFLGRVLLHIPGGPPTCANHPCRYLPGA